MRSKKSGLISKLILFVLLVALFIIVVLKFPQEGKRVVGEIVDLGQATLDLIMKVSKWAVNKIINR